MRRSTHLSTGLAALLAAGGLTTVLSAPAQALSPCLVPLNATVIRGTNGDDTLHGTNGVDLIYGYGGSDVIDGRGGADILDGGAGADTLDGGAQDDCMVGGDGDDVFSGALGRDRAFGGPGADLFNTGYDWQFGGRDQFDGGPGQDELWWYFVADYEASNTENERGWYAS